MQGEGALQSVVAAMLEIHSEPTLLPFSNQPWRRVLLKSPRDRSDIEMDMLQATLTDKVRLLMAVCASVSCQLC